MSHTSNSVDAGDCHVLHTSTNGRSEASRSPHTTIGADPAPWHPEWRHGALRGVGRSCGSLCFGDSCLSRRDVPLPAFRFKVWVLFLCVVEQDG